MRIVRKVEYKTVIETDVSPENIYAFGNGHDVSILVQKNGKIFWKPLSYTSHVWYAEYNTVAAAIEGIGKVEEYKTGNYGPVMEFTSLSEFLFWASMLVRKECDSAILVNEIQTISENMLKKDEVVQVFKSLKEMINEKGIIEASQPIADLIFYSYKRFSA